MKNISEILQNLKELERRVAFLEGKNNIGKNIPSKIKTKKLSLKEFLLGKKLNSGVKKTLAIGYFLEKYQNIESFNIKDLQGSFKSVREITPKNLNDKINKNIISGHIMELKDKKDGRKSWCLTSSGEKLVENSFN